MASSDITEFQALYADIQREQMSQMLPSGGYQLVNNRATWAKLYLVRAGLLKQPRRGVFHAKLLAGWTYSSVI